MPVHPRPEESLQNRNTQRNLQQCGLQAPEVYRATLDQLLRTVEVFRPKDAQFDQEDIFSVLLYAATTASGVESAGRNLGWAPKPNTVREALKPLELERVEGQLNDALLTPDVARVLRKPREIAIDLTEKPYYGDRDTQWADFIWKRKARQGTSHFTVYASAYVMHKGQRITLAVHLCRESEGVLGALKWLIERILFIGIPIRCLYMDRGFYSVEILRYLKQQKDLPFCMAAPLKGKKDGQGLKGLVAREGSGRHPYTVQSPKQGTIDVEVAVVGHHMMGRWGKNQRVHYAYVIHRFPYTVDSTTGKYRSRFGIETSYRIEEKARARTTSPDPLLRLILFALALILQNLWVWLKWACVAKPRRGGRQILDRCFNFFRMGSFLKRAIETRYGLVDRINAPPP